MKGIDYFDKRISCLLLCIYNKYMASNTHNIANPLNLSI